MEARPVVDSYPLEAWGFLHGVVYARAAASSWIPTPIPLESKAQFSPHPAHCCSPLCLQGLPALPL